MTYGARANQTEDHWQEEESVEDAEHDNEHVHSEVVQLEQSRRGESEDHHSQELGERDTSHDRAAHCVHGLHSALVASAALPEEIHANVVAELDAKAKRSDQIHHEHCVHLNGVAAHDDVEHPHDAHELEEDKENAKSEDHSQPQTRKHLRADNDGAESDNDVLVKHAADVSVLVVVNVVQTVRECDWGFCLLLLASQADGLGDQAVGS